MSVLQISIPKESQSMQAIAASSLEALLPVVMDENSSIYKDYLNVFYPRRNPTKGSHTHRKHFSMIVSYLVEVSGHVNAAFSLLRYILANADYLQSLDPKVRAGLLETNLRQLKANINPDTLALNAKAFFEAASSGKAHIIKPSKKFEGGFDVIYSGLPSTAGTSGIPISVPQTAQSHPIPESRNYTYKELTAPGGKYTLDLALAATSAGKALQAKMLDEDAGTLATSHQRKLSALPLNFDFTKLLNSALSKLNVPSFEVPAISTELLNGLGKYFSILVVREANPSAVKARQREAGVSDEDLNIPEEFVAVNPKICLSLVMHLPEEIVEFITQTPKGGAIPLTPLNTWASVWSRALLRAPKSKQKGERVTVLGVPKYILSASSTKMLANRRKELGFYTEPGRSNEDDIFVANTGALNYCPKTQDLALENAQNYEKIMEEALQISFDAGTPLNASQIGETNPVFGLASKDYKAKISRLKASLGMYAGSLQAYSWDYNCVLTSSLSDPDKLVSYNLAGTVTPDALSIADYLRKPFAKSMHLLFPQSLVIGGKGRLSPESFGHGGSSAEPMLQTSVFQNFLKLYAYLLADKKVPSFTELVKEAAKEMDIKSLEDEKVVRYDLGLYGFYITKNLTTPDRLNEQTSQSYLDQVDGIKYCLQAVLRDASGMPRTNLAKEAHAQGHSIEDDDHFFSAEHYTLAEFGNVYNYLGGLVFKLALKHLTKVDKKGLMIVNLENKMPPVNYRAIVQEVMPFAIMLSKYVPDHEAIYEKSDELEKGNKKDESISVHDIHVPGSKKGFQLFPHQVESQKYLRNTPRFAILDTDPGGGKTISVHTDVTCLIGAKLIKRPLIIAPNNLIKNWVEDLHKITQGRWNVIPITTATYRTWGDERLTDLINNAPPNTIVAVGSSVLRLQKYPVVIGNHVEVVSGVLEFIKKFGFDYIAIDESHRVKNPKSALHKAARQLCNASCVKFVRLATGTFISNKLTDAVGQSAMFSPQIFRTPEEYEAENSEYVGDTKVLTWKKDTPKRAREQLSKYAAVITAKRKEWAFMLPVPIETFIPVRMEKEESEGGSAHQLMYDAILKETLDEIKHDENIKKIMSGAGDDEDNGDNDDDEEKTEGKLAPTEDLDDATLAELESALEPYLARLEQLLTDPLGDPFGEIYFKGIKKENFVSNKVLKIIERIRMNFQEFPWKKGGKYKLKDVVDVDDVRYVLMPVKGSKIEDESYDEEYLSKIHPSKDPRWKIEPKGKVIVFCRYTRTVNAIFRALPPDLKKIAVKFHGEVKDKYSNLEAFKSTPVHDSKGVQIFIANEQAISEGQNLQIANRLIRVESPWSPGELDQAACRIFRPDPSGEFSRENIWLDWVLTNGSLEVAKMGRLISKMLIKTQFDEADNPLYDHINDNQLPLIRMSLETIAGVPMLGDIMDYIDAYRHLVEIRSKEFRHMRETRPSKMMDVEETPMFEGAKILEFVPYVPNMEVPDRHNYGLVKLTEYLQDTDDENVKSILKDPNKLAGQYVNTEFGNGVITKVSLTREIKGQPEELRKITRVDVQLAGTGEIYSAHPSMIHLATNLTEETVKNFAPTTPWATKTDKRKAEKLRIKAEKASLKEAARMERAKLREQKEFAKLQKLEKLNKTKKKQQTPVVDEEEEESATDEELNNNIELYPVVYNGFLALEAITEDDDIDLAHYKFKRFGDYAYVVVKDYPSFTGLLNFLEKRYKLSPNTVKRLDALHDSFQSGKGRKFAVDTVPMGQLQNFYNLRHKLSAIDTKSGKPELKVYPVILNGNLMLNVDIATNPAVRKILNKAIPGTRNLKFKKADSIEIQFFTSKSELVQKVKFLKKEGFVITNEDELKTEIQNLKLSGSKTK